MFLYCCTGECCAFRAAHVGSCALACAVASMAWPICKQCCSASSSYAALRHCCFCLLCLHASVLQAASPLACMASVLRASSYPGRTCATERGLDPARRFERDAVGRELVSRPRRAVPAAPDGLRSMKLHARTRGLLICAALSVAQLPTPAPSHTLAISVELRRDRGPRPVPTSQPTDEIAADSELTPTQEPRASWQQHCTPTSSTGRMNGPSTIFLVRVTRCHPQALDFITGGEYPLSFMALRSGKINAVRGINGTHK